MPFCKPVEGPLKWEPPPLHTSGPPAPTHEWTPLHTSGPPLHTSGHPLTHKWTPPTCKWTPPYAQMDQRRAYP